MPIVVGNMFCLRRTRKYEYDFLPVKRAGNAKNCIYPKKCVVDNEDDCLEVRAFDHVCGKFGGFRRSGENFLSSDVEVMDCDNDHSDDPADWIYPSDLERLIGKDVAFFAVPSRNNGKSKDGKAARPRFHVYFPHDPITDSETVRH